MKYRPDIDGLRAISVIAVILFHSGLSIFKGGFIGVDIFFVISGYLITSLILYDLKNNEFNLINFYKRRAKRILPVLFFITASLQPGTSVVTTALPAAAASINALGKPSRYDGKQIICDLEYNDGISF